MLNVYTVSFFGHREVDNMTLIEGKLSKIIHEMIDTKEYVDFLVGRNGEFDQIVSSTVRRLRKKHRDDNSSLTLVLPYLTAEFSNNENSFYDYYDTIDVCRKSSNAHYKSAIQERNKYMVDLSDLVVFYLVRNCGGAYQTYKYAIKQNKNVIIIDDSKV